MTDPPRPLVVAAVLVGVEAAAFAVLAVAELAAYDASRPSVALTTGVFFLAYAAFLGFFAWRLTRQEAWARAPIVVAQLIHLAVGASFWGAETWYFAAALLLPALVVLVAVFHPRARAALERDRPGAG